MAIIRKSHKMDTRQYASVQALWTQIQRCEKNGDVQQVCASATLNAITAVCFTCGLVRTTIKDEAIRAIESHSSREYDLELEREENE